MIIPLVSNLVSIGIVTWNSAEYIPFCLQALLTQDYINLELILIDNGSSDRSTEIASEIYPQLRLVQNNRNRGFCGGHNQAIAAARGEYYLALNPDVVMEPDYITKAVEAMRSSPDAGMVATRLYLGTKGDGPARIDSTGLFIDRKRRQYLRGFGEEDLGQFNQPQEVFGVDGAAPLYRRAMLEDIKIDGQYFDEFFFAHKEDVDLAWRARILGWRCVYTPEAVGYHQRTFRPGEKTRKRIADEVKLHAVKNRYMLLIKNESDAGWRRDGARILLYDLKILAYLLIFERTSLAALPLVWKNRVRAIQWRDEIRRRARVSNEEQLAWFS